MTSLRGAGESVEKSRTMCELDEIVETETRTSFLLIIYLFLILVPLSVYINIRLLVIIIRRFWREKSEGYYPMLMVLYVLPFINCIIILLACTLPFFILKREGNIAKIKWQGIVYPFIYALVTPSLIALADICLCAQRVYAQKFYPGPNSPPRIIKWIGPLVFFLLSTPVGYISIHSQRYTMVLSEEKTHFIFVCFLIDNIFRTSCATLSFVGYSSIWFMAQKKKRYDAIIRQALPIAGFQVLTIGIQCILELPFTPRLEPYERVFLDICFSSASSVAVPLCIIIGEREKRRMFYDTFCCCYCYCEPRLPQPKPIRERNSKADRQKIEEEEAIKERRREREERRKRRIDEDNFHNLDESIESQESAV